MAQIKTLEDFNKRLTTFTRSQTTTMNAAADCAAFAITHFKAHGDLGPAQRFHDAMVKNYTRRAAFVKWLLAHAPVVIEGEKFSKDKSKDALPFRVEDALKVHFWEFSPEPQVTDFSAADFWQGVEKLLKRYENEKRMKPKDMEAKRAIDKLHTVLEANKPQ